MGLGAHVTKRWRFFLAVSLFCGAGEAHAQTASAESSTLVVPTVGVDPTVGEVQAPPQPISAPVPPCTSCIPALTPIELVIDADLGSKISTTGQTFPLHLAAPLVIDGREMLPAGTAGQGEVVHAKKAGGGGASGELVLAARFLTVGDRTVRLRSMRTALAGADRMGTVNALNAVSAAALPVASFIGFAITGRNVVYPKGTVASAKIAEDFTIGLANEAPAVPVQPESIEAGQPATEAAATQ